MRNMAKRETCLTQVSLFFICEFEVLKPEDRAIALYLVEID